MPAWAAQASCSPATCRPRRRWTSTAVRRPSAAPTRTWRTTSQEAAPAPVVQVVVQEGATRYSSPPRSRAPSPGTAPPPAPTPTILPPSPGAEWLFAARPTTSLGTGRHTFTLDLFFDYPGTDDDFTKSVAGYTFVVNRSSSPYRAGWSPRTPTPSSRSRPTEPTRAGCCVRSATAGGAFYADAGGGDTPETARRRRHAGRGGRRVGVHRLERRAVDVRRVGPPDEMVPPSGEDVVTYTHDGAGAGTAAKVATVASPDGGLATCLGLSRRSSGHDHRIGRAGDDVRLHLIET